MGAWSHEPFGNDDASDWVYRLEYVEDLSVIESAIDSSLEADDYLEAPEASEAIAAIEVLAKLLGKGTQSDSYTEGVDKWVKSVSIKPDKALLEKANQALLRILGENSELRELWDEAGGDEWVSSISSLQIAISA